MVSGLSAAAGGRGPDPGTFFFDSFEDCEEFIEAYPDNDGDLFGADDKPTLFCRLVPPGYVLKTGDCDDTSAVVYPGNPEICDDLDNDCNGPVDDGLPGDSFELNESCPSFSQLTQVGSNQQITYNTLTILPAGDEDYFRIPAEETDETCQACDGLGFDEDYQLDITLSVPAGAGSYMFCTGMTCESVNDNCQEVVAGNQDFWRYTLDGECPGNDAYTVYVRIYGVNAPASECRPYTLTYSFTPGCF